MDLFTEKLKLTDIDFSFSIKELVKELMGDPAVPYRKEGDIPFHRRHGVQEKAVTDGLQEGQVRHWISTVDVDTYGEVMLPKGAQLKYYRKNPMVLWAHNYTQPENVMGSNLEIESTDKGLMTLTQFALSEPKAAQVYRLYKSKHLRMWSVGFIPLKGIAPKEPKKGEDLEKLYEWVPNPEKVQWIHQRWRLLEYSAVPVGANPGALTIAVKDLKIDEGLHKEIETKMEEVKELWKLEPSTRVIVDLGSLKPDDSEEEKRKAEEEDEAKAEGEEEEFVAEPDEEGNVKITEELFQSMKTELEELRRASENWTQVAAHAPIVEALEEIKAMRVEIAEQKEGRVLSGKNREIVEGAVEAMRTATERLEDLLEATEKPKKAEEEKKLRLEDLRLMPRGAVKTEEQIKKEGKQKAKLNPEAVKDMVQQLVKGADLPGIAKDLVKSTVAKMKGKVQ